MFKKIVYLAVLTIICIGLLSSCVPKDTTKETVVGDFSVTLTVNKKHVCVGGMIKVTITLKNLSGKDIPIELTDWQTAYNYELSDMLEIAVYPKNEDFTWSHALMEVARGRDRKIIEKDAVIQRSVEYRIEKQEDYNVDAEVIFTIINNETDNQRIRIYVEPIDVYVRR